jgi:hypothetical protein
MKFLAIGTSNMFDNHLTVIVSDVPISSSITNDIWWYNGITASIRVGGTSLVGGGLPPGGGGGDPPRVPK